MMSAGHEASVIERDQQTLFSPSVFANQSAIQLQSQSHDTDNVINEQNNQGKDSAHQITLDASLNPVNWIMNPRNRQTNIN